MPDYPPELRQQAITSAARARCPVSHKVTGYHPCHSCRAEVTPVVDAVLPIITRHFQRESWQRVGLGDRYPQLRQKVQRVLASMRETEKRADTFATLVMAEAVQPALMDLEAELDQLRQANANNLEGWAQDRAGLERRYLRAEQERDALRRLVRWVWEVPNFSRDDVPEDLRSTLDATLTETPNE